MATPVSRSASNTASIAWNPAPTDRLLIAGDERSLPAIVTLLATLPADSRGQVFVEVDASDDVGVLVTPGRVVVCWLVRERGQSLRRSVDAWLSEMLPTDLAREHTIYSWIAADGPARVLSSD
ncbi:MAG: SIP domain-containing protein [Actinomycetota bacterium]